MTSILPNKAKMKHYHVTQLHHVITVDMIFINSFEHFKDIINSICIFEKNDYLKIENFLSMPRQ